MLHCVPFQCSTSVCSRVLCQPTAHTSLDATAATPSSSLKTGPRLGLGTIVHCAPSQCSVRVCWLLPSYDHPTAHTSLDATAETAKRRLAAEPVFGLGTMLHPEVQPGVGVEEGASVGVGVDVSGGIAVGVGVGVVVPHDVSWYRWLSVVGTPGEDQPPTAKKALPVLAPAR